MKLQLHAEGKKNHQKALEVTLEKKIAIVKNSSLFSSSEKEAKITKLREEYKRQLDTLPNNLY